MRIKILVAGALGASLLLLSACGVDPASPGTAGTAGASGTAGAVGGGGSGDRDACLIGTWQVDVNDMATQAAAKISMPGAKGTGGGSLTLRFGDDLTITYDNSLKLEVPMSGSAMEIEAEFDGMATSTDWTAKDGKFDGTIQSNTVTQNTKATVGGNTVPMPSVPFQGLMEFSDGKVTYTCSGSSASIIGPGITWKLSKA